jgi:hypothetical protein
VFGANAPGDEPGAFFIWEENAGNGLRPGKKAGKLSQADK